MTATNPKGLKSELKKLRSEVRDLRESVEEYLKAVIRNQIDFHLRHPAWVDESRNPKTQQEYIGEIHTMLCDLLMERVFHELREDLPPDEGFEPRMWNMEKLTSRWNALMEKKRKAEARTEHLIRRIEIHLDKNKPTGA